MLRIFIIIITTLASHAEATVSEKQWFLHPFGELRSYHGDWLAVCSDEETGNCRLVNYILTPGDSFYGRGGVLTFGFYKENGKTKNYLDVNAPGVAHPYSSGVVFTFDHIDLPILADNILSGGILSPSKKSSSIDRYDVYETFSMLNSELIFAIKNNMKKARWLNLSYRNGQVRFSLRGFSSAYKAVKLLRYND